MDMAGASEEQEAARPRAPARSSSASFTHTPISFGRASFGSADHAPASAPPVEALFWPPPPPSPAPWFVQSPTVTGFAIAQSLQTATSIGHGDKLAEVRSVKIENLHVHIHDQSPTVEGFREEYESYLHRFLWPSAGTAAPAAVDGMLSGISSDGSSHGSHGGGGRAALEPSFTLASLAEGINFGRKFAKGFYRAVKHVDERRHLLIYTQSPSTMQTLFLAMSLGLSTKRAKHVIFLLDSGPPQHLAQSWPLHIHLREITSLIQNLGATFEYTRSKVKKNHFSLYIFGIKQRGTRFSTQGMQTWSAISYWAHNLPDYADNGMLSSFLTSLGSSQHGASF